MKIAIMNYTGTVGKTTVVAHLLAPRMKNAPVFAIETINETAEGLGVNVSKIRGEKFRELFKELLSIDDAIIDVGASNVEDFLDGMVRFDDSHLEIDRFFVPTTSGIKEQKETMLMLGTLADFGIPPEKIHVIFNRVEADVQDEFPHILSYARKERNCTANPNAAIFENEVFDMLAMRRLTISAALDDDTNYKEKLRGLGREGDPKLISLYADMHVIKALAKSVNRNLDTVFSMLTA